jgi:hypothetical protein
MATKKNQEETFVCPVGKFFSEIDKIGGRKSKFFDHMNKSKLEFLRAIRSIVDERIEDLQKKSTSGSGKKATKIKVE